MGQKTRQAGRRHGPRRRRLLVTVMVVMIGAATMALVLVTTRHLSSKPPARSTPALAAGPSHFLSDVPVRNLHAFGDSITAGYGLPAGEAWPYVLARRLNVHFDDSQMHAVLGGAVMDWGAKDY